MTSPAGPTLLDALEEETGVVVGSETRLTCQLECSPLCRLEWLVDGQLVVEEETHSVEEEIVKEEKEMNRFTGVKSTLTWIQLERTDEKTSVTCRSSVNVFLKLNFLNLLNFPGQLLVQLKMMLRRKNMQLWRAQLS